MGALRRTVTVETRLFLRDPTTVVFGVLFPTALLLGLGTVPALREPTPESGGLRAIDVWAPTALVFGMVMIAVQHVPAVVATYRERGILRRLSTTPLPPQRVLLAQVLVASASVVVSAVLLVLAAWVVLDVAPPERPLEFVVAFVVGYAALLGSDSSPRPWSARAARPTRPARSCSSRSCSSAGPSCPAPSCPTRCAPSASTCRPGPGPHHGLVRRGGPGHRHQRRAALLAPGCHNGGHRGRRERGRREALPLGVGVDDAGSRGEAGAESRDARARRHGRGGGGPPPRLAWREEQLRVWDLLQLFAPWLLLTVSTVAYLVQALPPSGTSFWPEGASALGLIAATALWVLFGQTLPLRRRALRPVPAGLYLVGLLALCVALMTVSDVFLVLTVAGFFQAYLLRPWQVGVLGVLATSVALNGAAMGVGRPSPDVLAEFLVIVTVQTAAIGAGILLTARSEPEERRREELVARLEAALHENAGLHAQLVVQARESGAQDERQRLAGEIHDTLAQGLAGIITQLQAAERSASAGTSRTST